MDYVYYAIKPKSEAAAAIKRMEDSAKKAHDFATQFGEKHLKKTPFSIIANDETQTPAGFCPKDSNWRVFLDSVDMNLWSREDHRGTMWLRPRKPRGKSDTKQLEMFEAWSARPKGISWRDVTFELFGLCNFTHGMRGYGATLQTYGKTRVTGVPYPVTTGQMTGFGSAAHKFKLAQGLERLPNDEAMQLIYADFGKKSN